MTRWGRWLLLLLLIGPVAACGGPTPVQQPPFRILSGSENQALEPIVQRFARDKNVPIAVDYLGSVDIMLALEQGAPDYDAVWPANSLWVALGDRNRLVRSEQSIMRSPVVFGVKQSVAQRLGWIGRDVRVNDILEAAEAGRLKFMMTSATQSNSGASAYFGYLYAFAGNPEVLSKADLEKPDVRDKIRRILGAVDRSAGSSGWLKDLFLQRYDQFDAMVNYESLVIEANKTLVGEGREPLYAVYPVDGLAIADSPFGYVNHGDPAKERTFTDLQAYLLSPDVQREILGLGRRVGPIGIEPQGADPAVFNPAWGIDLQRVIAPIRFPDADVIREALDLYQTAFRKGSFTVFCLDFSGSMKGDGERDLKQAMATLLDQQQARSYLLQASPDDVTVVIPFNQAPIDTWVVQGNDPQQLAALQRRIAALQADGNTNIYDPVLDGYETMERLGIGDRFPSVILMTDGRSNAGSFASLQSHAGTATLDTVPVFAILFGDASQDQLKEITDASSGRIFDGTSGLVDAFRQAKGYN